MFNSIKPTRLWHLTGKKHFQNMLDTRLNASDGKRFYAQRERKDLFSLLGIVMSSVTGLAFAFGMISLPKECKKEDPHAKKKKKVASGESGKKCGGDPCPKPKSQKRSKPCPPPEE